MAQKMIAPQDIAGFDLSDPMHHWALNMLNYGGGALVGPSAIGSALELWPVWVRMLVDDPKMARHRRRPPLDPGELVGWDGRNPDHHMAMWLLAEMYPKLDEATIELFRSRWPEGVESLMAIADTLRGSIKPPPQAPPAEANRAARRRAKAGRPAWWPRP